MKHSGSFRGFLIASTCLAMLLPGCGGDSTPNLSGDLGPAKDNPPTDIDVAQDHGITDPGIRPDPGHSTDYVFDIVPGGFLAPCSSNGDCASGFCVEGPDGMICTRMCITDECPPDFLCAGIVNTYPDVVFVCIPKFSRVCQPCAVDGQCGGGRCVALTDGEYCSVPCGGGDDCPDPYECRTLDDNLVGQSYCLPPSGTCACRAADAGVKRFCQNTNEQGTCFGYETCDPAVGFTGCDARVPAVEDCNGIDDDCNGTPDDGLPQGEPCERTNEFGTCTGTRVCLGPQGWACTATEPAAEICDGIDNDCKDGVDDPFKIDEKYGTLEHCGACNRSCVGIFPNSTPECDLSGEVPRCVVVECDPGFFRLNDYQCIPLTSTLCSPCVLDTDCIVDGARCLPLGDGGNYCGHSCDGNIDCPDGYSCLPADGGSDQCQPDSGSCACTGSELNLSRGCSVTSQDPGNPGAPVYTCYGIQYCLETGWGTCELPAETCDGLDNDCNGKIDEGFIDPLSGKYVDDENCGVCGNNCQATQVLNGHGACDTTRTVPDCKVMCNDGFFDVDKNPANGCECEYTSALDLPGGEDANCDGIDGDVLGSVFVAKWGTNGAAGTIEDPLLKIQSAIDLAAGSPDRNDVYVATGVYTEPVVMKAGVGVYGGYSADFRVREPIAYETVVLGSVPTLQAPGAITAIDITGGAAGSTALDGFVVFAYSSKATGGNAIGLYVKDCDASLAIRNSRLVGGDGGDGQPGVPGVAGNSGNSGLPGTAAYDIGQTSCTAAKETPGGGGGSLTCGTANVSGGAGGRAVCPLYDETPNRTCPTTSIQTRKTVESGVTGQNNAGSTGAGGLAGLDSFIKGSPTCTGGDCGTCRIPEESRVGANGIPGRRGNDGGAGVRCAGAGTVSGGLWAPNAAMAGDDGTPGGGGGGGGAAGGVQTVGCSSTRGYSDIGGSGGGGGAGGCGATGGQPGVSGGGSFALFLVFTSTPASIPQLADLVVAPGRGGHGGNGGPGGVGGKPGAGANGGPDAVGKDNTFCTANGGSGAIGGAGGHGGGGGGGCGGPSYGLFVHGAPAGVLGDYKTSGLIFEGTGSGGTGGLGGASLGTSGQNGEAGVAADFNF